MNTTDKSTDMKGMVDFELTQKFHRLNGWIGLPSVVKGKWSARQPAVLAASFILGLFIFSLEIPPHELALILSVVLITSVCALISTIGKDNS